MRVIQTYPFAIKILFWLIEAIVEECDNFAHPEYMSFSLESDASSIAVLQVDVLHDAVHESSGR